MIRWRAKEKGSVRRKRRAYKGLNNITLKSLIYSDITCLIRLKVVSNFLFRQDEKVDFVIQT